MKGDNEARSREPPPWMNEVKANLDDIEDVVGHADEAYRPILYGKLVEVVIQDARSGRSSSIPADAPASRAGGGDLTVSDIGKGRFGQFLRDYSISMEMLANVVDLDSGVVLTRSLGSTKAEKTRRLAALLALVGANKAGAFYVSRDDLVHACEEHAAYDTANFARYMKAVEFNGAVVFTSEGDGYKVSRPGEAFVADVVKSSLGPSSEVH